MTVAVKPGPDPAAIAVVDELVKRGRVVHIICTNPKHKQRQG